MEETQYAGDARQQAPQRPDMDEARTFDAAAEPIPDTASEADQDSISAYRAIEERRRKKRRKRIGIGVAVAAVALAAIGGLAAFQMSQQNAIDEEEIPTGFVTLSDYEASVSASGSTQPNSQVVVTPEVEGIIEQVMVAEGDMVAKGDVLLTLKNDSLDKAVSDAEQGVRQAQNGITSAERSVQSANNALANAQSHYDSVFSRTYDDQETADAAGEEAANALESAQQGVESANLELDNANIALTNAQEALDQARQNASKRSVEAPAAGAIVAMKAKVGAAIGQPSGASASAESITGSLMTIADLSQMRVTVQVNEIDINKVAVGQAAEVTFSSIDELVLEGTVEHIAALASGSDNMGEGVGGIVTYDVDIVMPKPDPRVKPGMTARVKIVSEQLENVLTVPTAALMETGENTAMVSVVLDGNYANVEEREVTVLAKDSTTAAIEGDVEDGDEVLLSMQDDEGADDGFYVAVG